MVQTGFSCIDDPQTLDKLIRLLTIKWFPVVLGAACREAAGVGADASRVGEGCHTQLVSAVDHLSKQLS